VPSGPVGPVPSAPAGPVPSGSARRPRRRAASDRALPANIVTTTPAKLAPPRPRSTLRSRPRGKPTKDYARYVAESLRNARKRVLAPYSQRFLTREARERYRPPIRLGVYWIIRTNRARFVASAGAWIAGDPRVGKWYWRAWQHECAASVLCGSDACLVRDGTPELTGPPKEPCDGL